MLFSLSFFISEINADNPIPFDAEIYRVSHSMYAPSLLPKIKKMFILGSK